MLVPRVTKPRMKRVLVTALGLGLVVGACRDDQRRRVLAEHTQGCLLDSDCADPLFCVFEVCHISCTADRDCLKINGGRCVHADADHPELMVCQLPQNAHCVTHRDCKDKELCAADGQCRDWCSPAESCPLDLVCSTSGFCARSEELDGDGELPIKGGGTGGSPGEGGTSSGFEQAGAGAEAMSSGGSSNGTGGTSVEAGQPSSAAGAGGNTIGGAPTSSGGGGTLAMGGTLASGGTTTLGGSVEPGSGGARAEGGAPIGAGGSDEPGLVDESEPNGERTQPMPFPVGSTVQAAFLDSSDHDYYELSAPAEDLAGGYFEFAITDIPDGEMTIAVQSTVNFANVLTSNTAQVGVSRFGHFATAPGEKYLLWMRPKAGTKYPYDYKVQIKYTKAIDSAEPNDTRLTARPLSVGDVANNLLFTGYRAAAISSYDDWYAVDLAAGPYTALLTQVAASTNAMAYVWNSAGSRLTGDTEGNRGGDVTFSGTISTAGTYYFQVTAYDNPSAAAVTPAPGTIPAHFTQPYAFSVTQ